MTKPIILAVLALSAAGSVASATHPTEEPKKPKAAAKAKKPAGPKERFRVFANAAFTFGTIDYSQSRTFRQYAEDGTVDTQYSADRALGFELGLHYRFKPSLGAMVSFSTGSRDASLSYSAKVPHPFFLDRPRSVSGTEDGLSYSATSVHLDFVYRIESGALEVFLFAGPSYVDVKADLVSSLSYRDVYPYDEVTVDRVSLAEQGDSGFGFNLGAGLDYRFGKTRRFGLGAQLRYTAATTTLAPAEGPTIDAEGGGFQAAVGVRVFF